MNEQLKKFKLGDIVLGKVIEIEPLKALIKIEGCEPVYIIKEVASSQVIETIAKVLQLNKIYEFCVEIDYAGQYYNLGDYYLSIVELEVAMDIKKRRVAVSTRELEMEPGDMLKNPQIVYNNAEKMAIRYRKLVIEKINNVDSLN